MKTILVVSVLLGSPLLHGQVSFLDPIVLESPNPHHNGLFGADGVGSVPDVNGDGVPDIIIGAVGEYSDSGRVYIFDGVTRQRIAELQEPHRTLGAEFGAKIAGIGDLNGNGSGEVIVAAHGSTNTVYVLDGSTRRMIHGNIFMRARSLSSVPDATGDGVPEILASRQGLAVLHDGASGEQLRAWSTPSGGTNMFGWACSGVPDVNGNGGGDVIVGDWRAHKAHVYDGTTGQLLRTLADPDGTGTEFGRSVAGLDDINGDGQGEIIVGAGNSGKDHLFDGATGQVIHTLSDPLGNDGLGWVVSALPDVTRDGKTDLVVSGNIPGLIDNAFVFDPVTGDHLATLPGNRDFGGGDSIAGIPDLNRDGLGEVLVANWGATSSAGHSNAGQVLLYLSVNSGSPLPDTIPIVTQDGISVTITWEVDFYDKLQVSTDHRVWEDISDVDARTASSHSEALGIRGPSSLYRLSRD